MRRGLLIALALVPILGTFEAPTIAGLEIVIALRLVDDWQRRKLQIVHTYHLFNLDRWH